MNIPEWIKSEMEQKKQTQAANDAAAQEAIDESMKIATKSHAFWQELIEQFKRNTDALHNIGLSGSTSLLTKLQGRGEQHCRVQVVNSGIDEVYTDLFYAPGGTRIRCWTIAGPQDDFMFVLLQPGDRLAIVHGTDPAVETSYMAQSIVRRMADHVRRRR